MCTKAYLDGINKCVEWPVEGEIVDVPGHVSYS